jgi:hypothetical protein
MFDDPTSLAGFVKSLATTCVEALRRNKLPAWLATLALIVSSALALSIQFDERVRYSSVILPDIEHAENQFFAAMDTAEQTSDENWRLQYFLEAHHRAKDVLRIAKSNRPTTIAGRRAHAELIRYYELVDEELAIIRTEMSLNEKLDYMSEWKMQESELSPIRERWASWVIEDKH